ncbi:MAG: hypothetical protein E7013_02000 [Alphaproteobacteria bacterium]|nr:hypothetical protein [Alphaproteobacteria bacterium]
MKKTALFVLTSCALAGCYTSPEMTENKYRQYYSDTEICGTETMYQNKNLRDCIEGRLADEDLNKKTVSIVEVKNSLPLVVPKTDDDEEMLDASRVYEVVDIRKDASVVVENGVASEEEIKKDDVEVSDQTVTTDEINQQESVADEVVSQESAKEEVREQEQTAQEEVVVVEDFEKDAENKLPEFVDGEMVEVPALDSREEDVQADNIEVVDDVVHRGNDVVVDDLEENKISDGVLVENSETVQSDNGNAQSINGVTLVVGPLKEDLVIEVKTAAEKKEEASQTKEVKTIKADEVRRTRMNGQQRKQMTVEERREMAKKRYMDRRAKEKNSKNEKEVLPSEEK